jgi:hypothetical protein
VQRALDACAVIVTKLTDMRHEVFDVALGYLTLAEHDLTARETRFRHASQVHDNFQELVRIRPVSYRLADVRGKGIEKDVKVICDRSA